MNINSRTPRKALNKAFLKIKPNRSDIERFKSNFIQLLDHINEKESEEYLKNLVSDFFKRTYYEPSHFINTKGRNDLVIHTGDKPTTPVGIIIEAKKPSNKSEMLSVEKLNAKALQELLLYYLRERISQNNIHLRHLIVTNIYEWYVFDASLFEKWFAHDKKLIKLFTDFENGTLTDTKTDFFYKQIAEPTIAGIQNEIEFVHFDIRDYDKILRNEDKQDDKALITLFKLLSPEHLLKLPFANDSNSLDKRFYDELLHLIGLTEIKEGSKKLIQRAPKSNRNSGSLLENAIIQLDTLDKVSRLKQNGESYEERLFTIGLELSITWVNRILFLKLLEAQLLTYHKGDKAYTFLNTERIKDYDDLNALFFQVLARLPHERIADVKTLFDKVPYLNSSLFEPTDLEKEMLFINQLKDNITLPLHGATVLKDDKGKKQTGSMNPLAYFFSFLDAYDFTNVGSEDIQEENKTLINASVLGLIFEKINGYKDGSFFTPGFITMYMARETLRKAVVQKFNDVKGWNCTTFDELYNKIEDRNEANHIINSLKIVDPAVGSGHFLVSALNELIAIKNDLRILQDREGKRLKEYQCEVVNDELIITDEDGKLVDYNPKNKESQRIQVALFHEKQTLIENCLFGVDINPNSVKICRLRLWIELLKHSYYKSQGGVPEGTHINPISSPPFEGGVPESTHLNPISSPPFEGGVPGGGGGYHLHNLPYLKTFRKELRNNLTPAEATLWKLLQGRKLDGRKFRRQHSVANYILDFYCPEEHLAIELDGQGHFEATQAEYDRERDLFLKHVGIKVLRFENKWVWEYQEGLLQAIRDEFGKYNTLPAAEGEIQNEFGITPPRPADTLKNEFGIIPPRPADTLKNEFGITPPRPADTLKNEFGITPPRPADTPPYKGGELFGLETLPNIDINIKTGNSLISRFPLDADLSKALKDSKWNIDSYKIAVDTYRNAQNKQQKRQMEQLIQEIKTNFRSEIALNDPKAKRLRTLNGDLYRLTQQTQLFERTEKEKKAWNAEVTKLTADIKKLETEIDEIKANKIYENAFEWRFEFPEVLDNEGNFVGFDVVMGNPPYVQLSKTLNISKEYKNYLLDTYKTSGGRLNTFIFFIHLSNRINRANGYLNFIIPNTILSQEYYSFTRDFLVNTVSLTEIVNFPKLPFEDAVVETVLIQYVNKPDLVNKVVIKELSKECIKTIASLKRETINRDSKHSFVYKLDSIIEKVYEKDHLNFGLICDINQGIALKGDKSLSLKDSKVNDECFKLLDGRNINKYSIKWGGVWLDYNIDSIHSCKRKDIFESSEKLMFRRVSSSLIFTYDNEKYFALNTLVIVNKKEISKGPSLKFILGIMNSKLMNYVYSNKFKSTKTVFSEIQARSVKELPIPIVSNSQEVEIISLSDRIINLNKSNSDTSALENQIDQMVYALYGLTEEEIEIVEGSVK